MLPKKIVTCDRKIIKIYDQNDGSLFTNIEPRAQVNDFELCGETGLIFVPQEQEKIGTYFIPEMGHAPKWCAFLENLTEEMEESNTTTLYDDFKFLTAADLDKLNASHLIGTPVLKAYMHGYFMYVLHIIVLHVSNPLWLLHLAHGMSLCTFGV